MKGRPAKAETFRALVRADRAANVGNPKAKMILFWFRVASQLRQRAPRGLLPITALVGVTYRIIVEWLLGVEIPWRTRIGPGLRLFHGVGLVINDGAILGASVTLRHGVTIGHRQVGGACPVVEDNVDIGAGATILGGITIGSGARIGAGAIVLRNVPPGGKAIGPEARVIDG